MELSGRTLGKYQLLEKLGWGGMGVVYKARDPILDRYVAIKVLLPRLARDEQFVQRFLREARVAAQLRHPGIVTVYEVGQEGNCYYFAMEYLPGLPLSEIIAREGPLALDRALPILEQVAAALDYIHQSGLVHRDVKPGNIIVDAEGRAVLTDFGIVRAAEGTRLTASGYTLGTPEYMAPEQAQGEEDSTATDIYSLGVVAYEMLAGEVPFRARTPLAVMMKHVSEPPPPLRERNPALPEEVERVVLWALAKDPSQRPASAADFVTALKAAAEGRIYEAQTKEPGPNSSSTSLSATDGQGAGTISRTDRPYLLPLVWGLLAMLMGIMVVAIVLATSRMLAKGHKAGGTPVAHVQHTAPLTATSTPYPPTVPPMTSPIQISPVLVGTPVPRPAAAISAENAAQIVELARLGRGWLLEITYSPDGRLLAVASSIGVYLYDASTLQVVRFLETESATASVSFSPGGELLASGSDDGMVRIWRVSDGALLRTLGGTGAL